MNIAEIAWEIIVAYATLLTLFDIYNIKVISSIIFDIVDIPRNNKGVFESPNALKSEAK